MRGVNCEGSGIAGTNIRQQQKNPAATIKPKPVKNNTFYF